MIGRKHTKVCTTLYYIELFLILVSAITGGISISAFASLLDIPVGIMSSAIGLKSCAITAGIKKYKTTIKKKERDKIVLLAKLKFNSIKLLISEALINSNISHDEFLLISNVVKEYDKEEKEIRDLISLSKILVYL